MWRARAVAPILVLLARCCTAAALRLPTVTWGGDAAQQPAATLPADYTPRARVVQESCSAGKSMDTKSIIWKHWDAEDEEGRERAMSDGYHFMERFAGSPARLHLVNSVSFFVDAAAGATDAGERQSAAGYGRQIAGKLESHLVGKWRNNTFGHLFGLRRDMMDALQVLIHERQLGVRAEASPLLNYTVKAYRQCENCFTKGDRKVHKGEEADAAWEAYMVDEARLRFGKAKFRSRVHVETLWPKLAARLPGSHQPFDRETVPLVAQMGTLASGSGRYALRAGDLDLAKAWARRHFAEAMATKDVEVVAGLVGFLKLYGCSEGTDNFVMQGSRWIIANQKSDGHWGQRPADSVSNAAEAYDVLEHVWAPFAALRAPPPPGNTKDPLYNLIRRAVDAAGVAEPAS